MAQIYERQAEDSCKRYFSQLDIPLPLQGQVKWCPIDPVRSKYTRCQHRLRVPISKVNAVTNIMAQLDSTLHPATGVSGAALIEVLRQLVQQLVCGQHAKLIRWEKEIGSEETLLATIKRMMIALGVAQNPKLGDLVWRIVIPSHFFFC